MKRVLILAAMLMATPAWAEFSVADIHAAAKAATDTFVEVHSDHSEHLVGYKVWKSGDDAKTRIYVQHGNHNMEFLYLCHKHDDMIECHEQRDN